MARETVDLCDDIRPGGPLTQFAEGVEDKGALVLPCPAVQAQLIALVGRRVPHLAPGNAFATQRHLCWLTRCPRATHLFSVEMPAVVDLEDHRHPHLLAIHPG